MSEKWNITLKVSRQKQGETPRFDEFKIEVDPMNMCSMRWNVCGHSRMTLFVSVMPVIIPPAVPVECASTMLEKLTCITYIRDVTHDGGTLKVEPLRNFPVVSDLVVDMGSLYRRLELVGARSVLPVPEAEIENPPPNGTKKMNSISVLPTASSVDFVSAPVLPQPHPANILVRLFWQVHKPMV